jgi:hypothetical protein
MKNNAISATCDKSKPPMQGTGLIHPEFTAAG